MKSFNKNANYSNEKLLPLHIIKGATQYDDEAVEEVLAHFSGYMSVLATTRLYDDEGYPHYVLDESLKHRLEAKLIDKLSRFKLAEKL